MPRSFRMGRFVVLAAMLAAVLALPALADTSSLAPKFGTPVRLPTFQSCGGYEPGIAIDKYGNIFVTAHKQNHCDAVASDPSAPDGVRAQSWLWMSTDGVNFKDMPGLTALAADQLDVGDEGDIALDGAGHLYFVDTKVVDDSFARWSITGPGQVTQDFARPVIPSLMPVDDRPWVVAHGSTVLYAGNEGDKDSYDVGSPAAGCTGPVTPPAPGQPATGGRYTVFMSYDSGQTFNPVGCTLPDSGWCRPAADPTPSSQYLYVVCTNDAGADDNVNNQGDPGFTVGTLWAYVSADDGHTWHRHKIDNYNSNLAGGGSSGDITWPSVTVGPDGTLYALFANPISNANQVKTGTTLYLYRSTNHGVTWQRQNVTPPNAGLIRYSWMAVSGDGHTIGVAYFTHQTVNGNWHVYAGETRTFGGTLHYSLVDPVEVAPAGDFAFGDFFEIAFDPVGRLNVVYTRCTDLVPGDDTTDCLNSDVYFARSLS
jgi:hypothetical protein